MLCGFDTVYGWEVGQTGLKLAGRMLYNDRSLGDQLSGRLGKALRRGSIFPGGNARPK